MERKKIPETKGFTIDEEGNVFDSKGNLRKTYHNGDGYVTTSVKWKDNTWWTVPVARLMGLSFLDRISEDQTEINHRDSELENNKLNNLEWVTSSQNNIHSEIMRKGNQYPSLYSMVNNEPKELYRNAHEASVATGISVLDIWDSVKNNIPVNGISFHHRSHCGNIPKQLHRSKGLYKGMVKLEAKPIKMLDILNGDILEFPSIHAAAEHFKTGTSHIHQAIPKGGRLRVFQKKYQVAYQDDDFEPMFPEDLKRALEHGSKTVIAYNYDTKDYCIFKNAKSFIEESGLSKKAVTTSLAKNILRKIDSWVAIYRSSENIVRLKDFVSSPVLT
jgi:hypothetical protein